MFLMCVNGSIYLAPNISIMPSNDDRHAAYHKHWALENISYVDSFEHVCLLYYCNEPIRHLGYSWLRASQVCTHLILSKHRSAYVSW